MGSLKI